MLHKQRQGPKQSGSKPELTSSQVGLPCWQRPVLISASLLSPAPQVLQATLLVPPSEGAHVLQPLL